MKKYAVRYAYATNLMEYLAGAEPTLSIEDCGKLPLATVLTDGVAFNKIEFIDSPFSLDAENDGYLMHVEKTASGPALAFVDDVESVRALMAELGGGKLHLGLNADGVKTGRALLIVPYSLELYTRAVSYISSGKLKAAVAKKKASAAKPAPVANPAPKPAPVANPAPKPAPVVNPAPKPAPSPFDGEPGSVRRVPDKPAPVVNPAPKPAPSPFDGEPGSVRRVPD